MKRIIAFLCMVWMIPSMAQAMPESFADVVDPLMPSVVNISTTQKVRARPMMEFPAFPNNDPHLAPFNDLLRQFYGPQARQREQKVTSLGSGFVISEDGYIVTNNHVVGDATDITVTFHDDTKLKARIIGLDAKTDLALLKVKAPKKLQPLVLGDSDKIRVGDWVIAIGNPFGLGGSVTTGILSARGRNINATAYDDFLQIDAAINRGNSGGPLFNAKGEVIGINSAIYSPTGTNIGIGFAIPTSLAKPVLEQLKAFGRTHRGWLGVRIQEVTEEVADAIGLKAARGAMVVEITPKGPAAGSGIEAGDVIVRFDGKEVENTRALPRIVGATPIGKTVAVGVWRKGREYRYQVKLGELPEDKPKAPPGMPEEESSPLNPRSKPVLGLYLRPLTPALAQQLGLPSATQGLVIAELEYGGEAAARGLTQGDVLAEANQQKVTGMETLNAAIKAAKTAGKSHLLLKILRGDEVLFMTLPLK